MSSQQIAIMSLKQGFVAALDQSGGSTPKALSGYGIPSEAYKNDEEMFALIHKMRTRIITSPTFTSEKIIAAILFEKTMDSEIENKPAADYLWEEKKIVPFLKIDRGLEDEKDGVRLLKDIHDLDGLLNKAVDKHIFGTKERSVINKASESGIKAIVEQQFALAKKVMSFDLVPILEPEVTISIPDKEEAEKILLREIEFNLMQLKPEDKIILKLSIPTKNNFYLPLTTEKHILRVVALSGGYSREEADIRLKKNKGLVASFSRALLQDLRAQQSDQQFDMLLKKAIDEIYDASVNKD